MIFGKLFKSRRAGIKRLGKDESPGVDLLLTRYPGLKAFETHHDNIYKGLLLVLPGFDLDTSSGWQPVEGPDAARRIADEMTGYIGTDKARWNALVREGEEVAAFLVTAVPGGFVRFEGATIKLDATHYQFASEPEGGRGGA
jgi:hypothetical protein